MPFRRAQLRFEARGGNPFPYPLVHVTIAGTRTTMIVDTGANIHGLASSFVKRLGLARNERDDFSMTDHAGQKSKVSGVSAPDFVVDGLGKVRDTFIVALDLPPIFDTLEIGGILSPQQLANPDESVVLDFPAGTLEVHNTASALERLHQRPQLRPVTLSTCKKEHGLRAYGIQAKVNDGHAVLLLDTGADSTDIKVESELGRQLESMAGARKTDYSASGTMESRIVHGAHVQFGARSETVDLSIVPGKPEDCNDGVLGIDTLKRCVFVLGDSGAAACEP